LVLYTQGKTGTNDIGSSYSVTGIGIDAKISYRLESVYLMQTQLMQMLELLEL
jgi:hypothetical protein